MSELLKVASALRRMPDEKLEALIVQRMINSSSTVDFFDLAEALTKPASVTATISGLPRTQAIALRQLVAEKSLEEKSVSEELCQELADLGLVGSAPEFAPFDSTVDALSVFAKIDAVVAVPEVNTNSPAQADVDRDAGVEIFETLQAINELIFDVEQRFVREVGKKHVGLPDLKRLANHLRKSNDYAREIYELAHFAKLITLAEGRWQLTADAEAWLSWNQGQQFELLATTWRKMLGDSSAHELQKAVTGDAGVVSLEAKLTLAYPFADGSVTSKIYKLASLAQLIGISANGWLSSWAKLILACDYRSATELAKKNLPQPQRKLICQADLTLIAPGPLPTDVEIQLRRFADTEQVGMASTYRLSALSLSHGLETGMKIEEIRAMLLELSEKDLPQPIEYLLKEADARFGRLTITIGDEHNRSILHSTDPILLTEIGNEIKLKPFGLHVYPGGSLASRFEPAVLYYGLREIGFVVIRLDGEGRVISPRTIANIGANEAAKSSVKADIARIREQEAKLGEAPDDDDLQRQIQLAIKNKARAKFTVTSREGEVEFLLEPIGIANGRLRAKDRKADIERTLPLTSILKVVID